MQQQHLYVDARANPLFLLFVLPLLFCVRWTTLCPSSSWSRADTIEPPDSKVHVLNHRNFDRFVKRNPLVLMEFYGKGAVVQIFRGVCLVLAAPGSDPFRYCCCLLVPLFLLLLPQSSLPLCCIVTPWFAAPWCGHCQQLAPEYREAAKKLASADLPIEVTLAKMNDGDEANRRLRAGAPEMFNFSSYPSLFVIKDGKYGGGWPKMGNETRCTDLGFCGEHEWYGGGRVADEIVFHMSAVAKGLDPYDEEKKTRPGLYKLEPDYDPRVIRDLVPEEFDEIVLGSGTEYT